MKQLGLFLLGVTFFIVGQLNAQVMVIPREINRVDTLDRVQYRVMYELKYKPDSSDKEYVVQDEVRLDIGEHCAKEYSYRLFQADSVSAEALRKGKFPMPVMDIVPSWVLYKNYPTAEQLTVDYRLPVKAPVKTYQEPMSEFRWQIKGEKKQIAGYECQRADLSFGSREWVAWFTPEIPLSYGPYKFGGLPGLIIDIADTNNEYHYSCISFVAVKELPVLGRWQWNQEPIDRKNLEKIIRQLYANPAQMMKALGAPMLTTGDPMLNLPYNPIER